MQDNGYRNRFRPEEFNPQLIEITKELGSIMLKVSSKTKTERKIAMEEWVRRASPLVGINEPVFHFRENALLRSITGGGCTKQVLNTVHIEMYSISLTTLLHEFRHAMQMSLGMNVTEEDARAWSCSLFNVALPKRFENAMRKQLLHFC